MKQIIEKIKAVIEWLRKHPFISGVIMGIIIMISFEVLIRIAMIMAKG